jgi:pimeloyl-ACP methyl ester carboxylesterase
LTCARVWVPLDPAGRVPGRISLLVARYSIAPHPTRTLVALPGGPGQSGVDLFARFRNDFQAVLGTRALVMFDERGVAASGQLDCRIPAGAALAGQVITGCADQLGPQAAFYSTDDTVADIEAIRRALRLGRIDLYGVSYGTFPATEYARRYPQNLAHLVLDSPLPADGDPDVNLDSFASIRRQLATVCTVVCRGLDPLGDLDRLLSRLPVTTPARGRLALTRDEAGRVVRSRGEAGGVVLSRDKAGRVVRSPGDVGSVVLSRGEAGRVVLNALEAADLDPLIRASIPAALQLGAAGDLSAVVRLGDLAVASEQAEAAVGATRPATTGSPSTVAVDVEPVATRCEDERFAWSSRDSLTARQAKVRAEEARLSPAGVAPFAPSVAIAGAVISACERWPGAGDRPAREDARLPGVPTLILSGEDDVRTPLEQSEALAAEIPGAKVLGVPNVGHAVLADDHSDCAKRGVAAFLTGATVLACTAGPPPPVDPVPPASIAQLAPAAPLAGEPGEVLAASVVTLRHDVGLATPYLAPGLAVAGTAGGGLVDESGAVRLNAISYVRPVGLTGTLKPGTGYATGDLRVSLSGRHYGSLRLAANGTITGTLGGERFTLPTAARQAIDTTAGLDFYTRLG